MDELKFWSFKGRVTRGMYALFGFVGVAAKYNLDRLFALHYGMQWYFWNYWRVLEPNTEPSRLLQTQKTFFAILVISALPFIWLGVTMTVKRLRDAGQSRALALLFFAPFVNLLFFAVLCILPSVDALTFDEQAKLSRRGQSSKRAYWPESALGSAAVAVLLSVLSSGSLGALIAWIDLRFFGIYGYTLFIGVPIVMGYLSVWVYSQSHDVSDGKAVTLATLSVAVAAVGLLALAVEGAICLVMAAPISWLLALFGASLAKSIHNPPELVRNTYVIAPLLVLALPLLLGVEHLSPPTVPHFQVRTSIEIAAPPSVVWKRIVEFPPLAPPKEWPFNVGIAYPIEARLTGEGLTADRECRFSTGSFKEPILAWETNKHFAFGVADEPLLMKEMSPYSNIHVRHLEDHDFQPERADFVLVPLANGGTRLEGTTTYQNKMWPGMYWRLWTDAIVHSIHHRVFAHVKELAEKDVKGK
jgi:uncharacterized membrane protein YhaH (DUF805 family)